VKTHHHPQRILVIGYGAIGTAFLPLLLERLPVPADRITVLDRVDRRRLLRPFLERGVRFEQITITKTRYREQLQERLGRGDLLIDLASYIDTLALVEFCQERGVLFLNTSVERWYEDEVLSHRADHGLLYPRLWRITDWLARHRLAEGATAVIDHGANPGLVSHFVKQGLQEIAAAVLDGPGGARLRPGVVREALEARAWDRLAEALGVRVVQISEIDTQRHATPRPRGEFLSTWSARTMREEALTLSELCWGTHEGPVPEGYAGFETGPRHMIYLPTPAVETWVESWTPGGVFPAMVIGHDETYTIGEQLTVRNGRRVRYRPTIYFAYQPCQAALESLQECVESGGRLQARVRVLTEDLVSGKDQLGCLLMGPGFRSWWIGSLLSIEEARALIGPGVNATTLQVSAALAAGLEWMLAHPASGPRLPDELPHDEILPAARPYLGPFLSEAAPWGPPTGRAAARDAWRFPRFLVNASLSAGATHPARVARGKRIDTSLERGATAEDRRPNP
jgi:homospermidine synthase